MAISSQVTLLYHSGGKFRKKNHPEKVWDLKKKKYWCALELPKKEGDKVFFISASWECPETRYENRKEEKKKNEYVAKNNKQRIPKESICHRMMHYTVQYCICSTGIILAPG